MFVVVGQILVMDCAHITLSRTTARQLAERQLEVAKKKAKVFETAVVAQPVPFVDTNGGTMQPKPRGQQLKASVAPALPPAPKVLVGKSSLELPPAWERVGKRGQADIILVDSLREKWASPAALQARLDGSRLTDGDKVVAFRGAAHHQHFVFWVSGDFAAKYPKHTKVLEVCSKRSGAIKLPKAVSKRLEVFIGGVPDVVTWPRLTYQLSADPSEELQRRDLKGKVVAIPCLNLDQLLTLTSNSYESSGSLPIGSLMAQ